MPKKMTYADRDASLREHLAQCGERGSVVALASQGQAQQLGAAMSVAVEAVDRGAGARRL